MTDDNLRFYNMGANVPKEACKEFKGKRFSGTDINRMWRTRVLTSMFGTSGTGWTFEIIDTWERQNIDGTVKLFAKGVLKYKDPKTGEWSEPVYGFGGNDLVNIEKVKEWNPKVGATVQMKNPDGTDMTRLFINDEAYKMVETDAFGHACSKIGIGESVYWNEATKYTQQNEEQPKAKSASQKTGADKFFGRPKATGESQPSEKVPSAPKAAPSDKEIIDAIYAAKGATKTAIQEYMTAHNIMSPYETTPEQRAEMYEIIKGAIA